MTRDEIFAKYNDELKTINKIDEHPQAKSMALNEARRWLDRELSKLDYPDDKGLKEQVRPLSETLSVNDVIKKELEIFDYIIARHWNEGSLSIYTYHNQIHNGTLKTAQEFLEYVQFMTRNDDNKNYKDDWKIYKINYEEIEC